MVLAALVNHLLNLLSEVPSLDASNEPISQNREGVMTVPLSLGSPVLVRWDLYKPSILSPHCRTVSILSCIPVFRQTHHSLFLYHSPAVKHTSANDHVPLSDSTYPAGCSELFLSMPQTPFEHLVQREQIGAKYWGSPSWPLSRRTSGRVRAGVAIQFVSFDSSLYSDSDEASLGRGVKEELAWTSMNVSALHVPEAERPWTILR